MAYFIHSFETTTKKVQIDLEQMIEDTKNNYKENCVLAIEKKEHNGYKVVFQEQEVDNIPSFIIEDMDNKAFIYRIVIDDDNKTIFIMQKER